jgi:hypothetical protein
VKTPTPGEFREFLRSDGGWTLVRGTKHGHYEKAFPDGTVLSTHVSWGTKKTLSPDTFRLILSTQLTVTEEQFWKTIDRKQPQRTTVVAAAPNDDPLTLKLRRELIRRLHFTDAQMIGMTGSQAKRLIKIFHESKPSS